MDLHDIINRTPFPKPWEEGENIPWNDPLISQRMLAEHLSQDHDSASRRLEKVDEQVEWIHSAVLSATSSRILDLACGPGLYTTRLALMGHRCMGIDCSPASIMYAIDQVTKHDVSCAYLHDDIRTADYGSGFFLVMLIYGEFNSFPRSQISGILHKAREALCNDGILLIEPHTYDGVRSLGRQDPSWFTSKSGLFAASPHICLEEGFWDGVTETSTLRYYVLDPETASVQRHAQTLQAYSDDSYRAMLAEHGFREILLYPSLTGKQDHSQSGLMAITARKG